MENIREFVSKADLHYRGIDRIPEAGMPVGNGRMGSLVWMDQEEMHMQWNRCDVFASDASSQSFPEMDTDYASGVGLIDISLGSGTSSVFSQETIQHLAIYDGRLTIKTDGVDMEIYANMEKDICYLHIRDRREEPQKIGLSLRTLRGGKAYLAGSRPQIHPSMRKDKVYSYDRTGDHLATSCLEVNGNNLALRQYFEEKEFFCQSLLEVKGIGRTGTARIRNQSEATLEWEAQNGELWIAISSAQSFEREGLQSDPDDAEWTEQQMNTIQEQSLEWWHAFWDRAPKMNLHSADGQADMVALHSTWFLYLMAVVSRGEYMARYGGLLFYTAGDYRYWGAQYWWHNQSCYYAPLVKLGCYELADACFNHILNSMENYHKAAEQQWGTEGIFIPETCWFSGPCDIPEELREEVRELYSLKKPWEERSEAFKKFSEGRNTYESRWNWEDPQAPDGTRGYGSYAYVNHIFSTTAKIAMLFWSRYVDTQDVEWLREKAYPVLRGTAMMYLRLPFIEEGEDGYLHIRHVNNHEDLWGACDTISELAGIHGILPVAVRAAEILGMDEELREEWRLFERRMVPIRTNQDADAILTGETKDGRLWCWGTYPVQKINSQFGLYHNLDPLNIYHILSMETEDGELRETGVNTYQKCLEMHGFGTEKAGIGELDPFVLAPGKIGDKEAVAYFVPGVIENVDPENFIDREGTANTVVLDNRMTLREGVQAIGAQRLGQAAESMACALCNAVPGKPGGEVVLHLFEGLPDGWDAEFELPGGNGYRVYACVKDGTIESLELKTDMGLPLVLRNPWGTEEVFVEYGYGTTVLAGERIRITGSCRISLNEEN